MVDIKGLDKARVLKALYDHSHVQGLGRLQSVPAGFVTVEICAKLLETHTSFDYLYGRVIKVELSGDEFDERLYDRDCGDGAAQRAVDSVRAEPENGTDASKEADGEKKEPSMDEKVKQTKEALHKILDILVGLPPDVAAATGAMLKMTLPGPGPMGGMMGMLTMMGGPFAPIGSPFAPPVYKPFGMQADERKERDIQPPPFPWDLSSMSRQG